MGTSHYTVNLTGAGACTADMVMRADMVMVIRQEEDKQWRIVNETLIKAKSVRGYRWVRGEEVDSLSLSDNPICVISGQITESGQRTSSRLARPGQSWWMTGTRDWW